MKQKQINKIEWKEVELGSLGDISGGGTPSRSNPNYWKGNIPWLKISNLKRFYVDNYDETITEEGLKNSSAKLFQKGTILISIFASLGDVAILNIEATTNQAIAGIYNLNKEIDKKYLALYLKSLKKYFNNIGRGVAQRNLNLSILKKTKIILPFLNGKPDVKEQERIVKLLEEAEELTNKSKKAEELLDEYLKSIFYEMFYEKGFKEVNFGNKKYFEIQSGGTPSRTKKEYWENGKIPWIGSTACKDLPINKAGQFITKKGLDNSSAKLFPKNTILIALVGATIGKIGILNFECATNQNIAGIIIKDKNVINSTYLFYSSKQLYPRFISLSSDTFKMANLSFVRSLKIPLPPLPLQQKFASIVEQVEKMKENINKTKQNSEELFNSLISKAFGGKL